MKIKEIITLVLLLHFVAISLMGQVPVVKNSGLNKAAVISTIAPIIATDTAGVIAIHLTGIANSDSINRPDTISGEFNTHATTGSINGYPLVTNNMLTRETIATDNLDTELSIPYPNPTSTGFYINVGSQPLALLMYDVRGSRVLVQQVTGKSYVNVSGLSRGVYIVRVNEMNWKLIKD